MTISIESRIDSVRLHRTGAIVTRRASLPGDGGVDLASGGAEVRVSGLPVSLDDSTLRIVPTGGASLAHVRVGIDLMEPPAGGETVDEEALRSLERDEASLRAELSVLGRARMAVDKVTLPRRHARSDGPIPPADCDARASFLRLRAERLRALFAEEHRLSDELARVVKRRAALSDALARQSGARPPEPMSLRKTAVFQLLRAGIGAVDFEISYFVRGALWAPAYALRIRSNATAAVELRAAVCQATGEDWSGVAVSFSTAEAMRFHELQELTSLRIGRAQAPKRKRFRALDDPHELFADFDRAFGAGAAPGGAEVEPDDPLDDEVTGSGFGAPPPAPGAAFSEQAAGAQSRMSQTMAAAMPAAFAPPLQQAMAPMPMAPPAMAIPMPASRSRQAPFDAAAMLPRKGGFSLFGGGGGGGSAATDDDELGVAPEPELELDGRLFAFESLRMPPPEAQKGRLTMVTPMAAYLEASRSLGSAQGPGVARLLGEVGRAADRLLATDPPRRHVLPRAESGFHHVMAGEHRVDVPADGAFHSVPVMQGGAPLVIRHVAVPRETSDVFRLATFENPFTAPLLAGPCDVYVDDDFLLTVDMPTVIAGGEARVGLGVDQAIKIARNTHFSEQTQGLMGGSLLLKHRIEVEVVSHLKVPASLEVRERVPTAHEKDEDIKIEIGEVSPAWQKWEPPASEPSVRSAFAWRVDLEPQKPLELKASYTIRIPSKLELVGGNRRD